MKATSRLESFRVDAVVAVPSREDSRDGFPEPRRRGRFLAAARSLDRRF